MRQRQQRHLDWCATTVRDAEMDALDTTGNAFHPAWNYTIRTRSLAKSKRLLFRNSLVGSEIAVGTVIAHRPPHRPGRAGFPHLVLTLSVA